MPVAHPGNEPIIVSLTIKASNKAKPVPVEGEAARFTAVWGYGSEGLALEMGQCIMVR
jgi:hypothetical protein